MPENAKVATTALTNPGLIAAARALSRTLVVVDSDADGMLPEALDQACARDPVAAVHVQPTFDNPRGSVMPKARREALAAVAERRGLWLIEDDPLGPLAPDRPEALAALARERTCYVASAAKVLALGLRVGMLAAPTGAFPQLAAALRASTWLTAPLLGEVLARWVRDGVAEQLVQRRVEACGQRGALARALLPGLAVHGAAGSPHLWIELPAPWSVGSLVAAVRDDGVLVAPGDDYVVDRSQPVHGVRLGLNAEVSEEQLREALTSWRACCRWVRRPPERRGRARRRPSPTANGVILAVAEAFHEAAVDEPLVRISRVTSPTDGCQRPPAPHVRGAWLTTVTGPRLGRTARMFS